MSKLRFESAKRNFRKKYEIRFLNGEGGVRGAFALEAIKCGELVTNEDPILSDNRLDEFD